MPAASEKVVRNMAENLISKVIAYIEKYQMLTPGDVVITGVSGGADSVCLLLTLLEVQKQYDITIRVVHIEHGIRGGESLADASFVKMLCERKNIPFVLYPFDVPEIAKKSGESLEEAGRRLRYQAFEQEAAAYPGAKIAVAHNQNDNAETMLHHLVRGSALQGMSGIAPVRGRIIRPLLGVSRSEIEQYLHEKHQPFRTDATNEELIYTRNRVRHEVLPVLEEINDQAVAHMAQTAELLRQTQEYMKRQADHLMEQYVHPGTAGVMIDQEVHTEEAVLRDLLLYEVLGSLAGSKKDIGMSHVKSICELFDRQVGRKISLPYDLCAVRTYGGIRIAKAEGKRADPENTQENVTGIHLQDAPAFTCRMLDSANLQGEIPKNKYTKWLDYDKIKNSLSVRNRRSGDYFWLTEDGKRKKLKQYFVDEKIPQQQRDQIPLVADGSHIVLVVGYRMSAGYKVTEHTKRILEIQYDGGKEENE